jgi:hypothetical protein
MHWQLIESKFLTQLILTSVSFSIHIKSFFYKRHLPLYTGPPYCDTFHVPPHYLQADLQVPCKRTRVNTLSKTKEQLQNTSIILSPGYIRMILFCKTDQNSKTCAYDVTHQYIIIKYTIRNKQQSINTDLKKQLPSAVTSIIFRPNASSWARNCTILDCFPCFFTCKPYKFHLITSHITSKATKNFNMPESKWLKRNNLSLHHLKRSKNYMGRTKLTFFTTNQVQCQICNFF